jgi:hypothetical protein
MTPIALLMIPGWRDPRFCVPSQEFYLAYYIYLFFLPSGGLESEEVINIWPVKPFETAPVIKGYTNKIEK